MKKVLISQATDAQVREFCEVQQFDLGEARDVPAILGILSVAWPHEYIFVPEDEELNEEQTQAVDVAAQHKLTGGTGANDPIVKLKIQQTPYPGGKDPVAVGHNGHTVVIQRNKLVDLPYRYYLTLRDAKSGDITQQDARQGETGEILDIEYSNYPMTDVILPPPEEVSAWHRRVDRELLPA